MHLIRRLHFRLSAGAGFVFRCFYVYIHATYYTPFRLATSIVIFKGSPTQRKIKPFLCFEKSMLFSYGYNNSKVLTGVFKNIFLLKVNEECLFL